MFTIFFPSPSALPTPFVPKRLVSCPFHIKSFHHATKFIPNNSTKFISKKFIPYNRSNVNIIDILFLSSKILLQKLLQNMNGLESILIDLVMSGWWIISLRVMTVWRWASKIPPCLCWCRWAQIFNLKFKIEKKWQ